MEKIIQKKIPFMYICFRNIYATKVTTNMMWIYVSYITT